MKKKTLHPFTQLAGLKSDKEFYNKYKSPDDFFKDYPEAEEGINLPNNPNTIYNQINSARDQKINAIPGQSITGLQPLANDSGMMADVQKGYQDSISSNPIRETRPNSGLPEVTPNNISPYHEQSKNNQSKNNNNDPDLRIKFNKHLNPEGGLNIPDGIALSMAALPGLIPNQPVNQNINPYNQALQTNPYGAGSRASFAKGGNLQGGNLQVEKNQFKYLSSDTMQIGGNLHTEQGPDGSTGTDISYNGTPVEAERGETVHIDDNGDAVVGGNMYIPGTKTKYKEGFKKVAKLEAKNSKIQDKASYLLNNYSPDHKFSASTFNTGTVMADAYEQHKSATEDLKQNLTDMQTMQLKMRGEQSEAKYGKKIKAYSGNTVDGNATLDEQRDLMKRPQYQKAITEWQKEHPGRKPLGKQNKFDDGIPGDRTNWVKSYMNKGSETDLRSKLPVQLPTVPQFGEERIDKLPTDGPNYMFERNQIDKLPITGYSPVPSGGPNPIQERTDTPQYTPIDGNRQDLDNLNGNITNPIHGLRNKFRPTDYLGEVATIFDRPSNVPSTQVRPIMESEYNVSLQQKKNSITSAFKPALDAAKNNPAQQAAIASQMAEQLSSVDSEELNYNQQNTGAIRARNLQELRGVRDTNVRLGEDQQNKQVQAKSITDDNKFRAIESISDKEAKRRYSNNQLGMYEQYSGWAFNPNNKAQQWQMLHPGESIPRWITSGAELDKPDDTVTHRKRTRSTNKGDYENIDEQTAKTNNYLGGKIAERKPSTTKKKLKYS